MSRHFRKFRPVVTDEKSQGDSPQSESPGLPYGDVHALQSQETYNAHGARLSPYSDPYMLYSPLYVTCGPIYGPYGPYSPQHSPQHSSQHSPQHCIYAPYGLHMSHMSHMSPMPQFSPESPNLGPAWTLRTESPVQFRTESPVQFRTESPLRAFPICSKVCGWSAGIIHGPCIWCNK